LSIIIPHVPDVGRICANTMLLSATQVAVELVTCNYIFFKVSLLLLKYGFLSTLGQSK